MKQYFPLLANQPDLIYLDSAATAQKPAAVIEAVSSFYSTSYANIHRGLYPLSMQATEAYEAARQTVASFISARTEEVVFTRGATESINLLASSITLGLQPGDEILLSELEHHANIVPWQQAAKRHGLIIRYVKITEKGDIDLAHFSALITKQTKVVSFSHCSNVLGTMLPAAEVKKILVQQGSEAVFILDASQSVAHIPLSVSELGCDFVVFSGHKLYGPSGTGVLWGRSELLETLPPYQTGGDMIASVTFEGATWNTLPWKFEAGTPNIEGFIGLAAAITFLQETGMEQVQKHTEELTAHTAKLLESMPGITLLSIPDPRSGIIAFAVDGIHPHDLADLLGQRGICIRAGHHCAMPLHASRNLVASSRISIGLYNDKADIVRCAQAIAKIQKEVANA